MTTSTPRSASRRATGTTGPPGRRWSTRWSATRNAALLVLHGRELAGAWREAAELLALVAGQDVEQGEDGVFRIARRVARDRVISTVDTEARHGHKSRARTFDGYKAHLAVDPDDELITNVTVTAANAADRDVVDDLLDESTADSRSPADTRSEPRRRATGRATAGTAGRTRADPVTVFGDSAYADGATLDKLAEAGHEVFAKVPPVRNAKGYSKDGSASTPTPARSSVRPGTPRRSGPAAAAAAWPASPRGAPTARCARPAPPPGPGG